MDLSFPLTILTVSLLLTAWAYRGIVSNMKNRLKELAEEEQTIDERYLFLSKRKKQLTKELQELKNRAILAQKDISSAEQGSVEDIYHEDTSSSESDADMRRAAEYMISKGLITIDQNERAVRKMETMKMDYLGVCITLGYINIEAAKAVVKSLGIHHSTLSAN